MKKKKILVVEDEYIVAKDLEKTLDFLGYLVPATVTSGEDAIARAIELKPDLILMDIRLEGEKDGIVAAKEIQKEISVPIIYITAYADEKTLSEAKLTEPYGYIVKPFKDVELKSTIEISLHKHKIEKQLKENRKWLDATLRSIGDAVIATNGMGIIRFINLSAEKLTGWSEEDAIGTKLEIVFKIKNF
ncbi:MAG: response regulator [Candidatus Lokiarchaeota archaeon]|nr:response regulator [Candidatus Lokiarchaeota archaeon]MBD3341933.1 response regulator [Candidatus Lokiarchaeota archaeon]